MDVDHELSDHIKQESFPCLMAKAVERIGGLKTLHIPDLLTECNLTQIHHSFCSFIEEMRGQDQLRSFVLVSSQRAYSSFEKFEEDFWLFLKALRDYDRRFFPHDSRVSCDPSDHRFSYSVGSEAFFILLLHPQSPRLARRFKFPAIVFNPHAQFERLRANGVFKKIKNLIRKKDFVLQGSVNPMLSDFGERSEVFQYVGRIYGPDEGVPLCK